MDTVYYTFTASRVRASGGTDLLKFVPETAEKPTGEVLDFQDCRRKLEAKAALRQVREVEKEDEYGEERPEGSVSQSGWGKASGWLELAASLSVLAVSAAAVAAFLAL